MCHEKVNSGAIHVIEPVTAAAPPGGILRMSRRVMNLAHFLTQNARRYGDRPGLIWGERSWSWREIDGRVSALAAALAARGIVKGDRILVHSKNCDEMFWSMFAAFRLGAVWVPTNFRLMPDEVAYLATSSGAKAFLCHGDFPDHAAAVAAASPALEFTWRIGEGAFGETIAERGDRRACGGHVRKRRRRPRRSLLVLLHLGHDRPLQGGGADPWPDGLCGDQSSRRPHARHDRARRLAGGRAAVAWRRRASARAVRARRADHPAADRAVRHRRGVPADREAPRHQHLHRADHPEDDGRASRRRPLRSFLAALCHLCRRADVSRGPEDGVGQARQGAGAVFRARRGHRQHHRAAARSARGRGRAAGAHRHLRLRAHRHAGLDPGR